MPHRFLLQPAHVQPCNLHLPLVLCALRLCFVVVLQEQRSASSEPLQLCSVLLLLPLSSGAKKPQTVSLVMMWLRDTVQQTETKGLRNHKCSSSIHSRRKLDLKSKLTFEIKSTESADPNSMVTPHQVSSDSPRVCQAWAPASTCGRSLSCDPQSAALLPV